MTRKEEILAAYDDAWSYKWESLTAALKDVTEEEAAYQHPIYSDVEREDGHPPSGSIMWHVVHLAHCYRHYVSTIERRPGSSEAFPPPEANSLTEAIANLIRCRAELRSAIASVDEAELDGEVSNYKTVAQLARMTVRHDAWHASQIVIAKRLYRTR
jgi:uncharacterized damage-inducible protein DinB